MSVELIRYTPDPDEVCGIAAATCIDGKNYERSLRVALESGHESVAEHASFTFRLSGMSRAAMAQLTRHRLASFTVESQRYVSCEAVGCVIPATIEENPELMEEFEEAFQKTMDFYIHAEKAGIPKEDARYILPIGVMTKVTMTMNARELRHFFALRCCNKAQWEIRAFADEMLEQCREVAPILFEDCGPGCVMGRCPEKRPCGNPRVKDKFK